MERTHLPRANLHRIPPPAGRHKYAPCSSAPKRAEANRSNASPLPKRGWLQHVSGEFRPDDRGLNAIDTTAHQIDHAGCAVEFTFSLTKRARIPRRMGPCSRDLCGASRQDNNSRSTAHEVRGERNPQKA